MDIYKATPVIIIGSLCSVIGYYGYHAYKKYINLMDSVKINNEEPNVIVNDHHMVIQYTYLNNKYTLRVPFDHDQVVPMTQYKVYGIGEEGEKDLTQQPGVPYLVQPVDLNCDHIVVCDYDLDEQRTYTVPPFYGNL